MEDSRKLYPYMKTRREAQMQAGKTDLLLLGDYCVSGCDASAHGAAVRRGRANAVAVDMSYWRKGRQFQVEIVILSNNRLARK